MLEQVISPDTLWIDLNNPQDDEIHTIFRRFPFHELDREAILEDNPIARVDTYDEYIFVILHFPKYDTKTRQYIKNEFDIFLSREYLVMCRYYESAAVDELHDIYQNKELQEKKSLSTGYLLYDMIDLMLDKTLRTLDRFSRDMIALEKRIVSRGNKAQVIRDIMVKKRNIIALKHMITPQQRVFRILEQRMNALYEDSLELYFENLEDKVDKIVAEIELIHENIESLEETMKSLFDLETNTTIKYLTYFSAFMLPLTLVTSFFGMNIASLPFRDDVVFVAIAVFIVITAWLTYILAKYLDR